MNAVMVKASIVPLDFYRTELSTMPPPRREHGWVDGGLCPFHQDRHAGSFYVNLDCGSFKCFSCDASGGDIIAFEVKRYGLGFRETMEWLAETWGIWP